MPDDAPLPIHGFGATDYRTFGDVQLRLGRLTVVTGANNSGKSSLLALLDRYPETLAALTTQFSTRPSGTNDVETFRIGIDITGREGLPGLPYMDPPELSGPLVEAFVEALDGTAWVNVQQVADRIVVLVDDLARQVDDARRAVGAEPGTFEDQVLSYAIRLGERRSGRGAVADWIPHLASTLVVPRLVRIEDVRRTATEPLAPSDLWRLAQAASFDTTHERFEGWTHTLELILRDVFGDAVRYVVRPEERSGDFRLTIDGEDNLPLGQVGAGVREVVAIAFRALCGGAATVLVIEEPENCLHPSAARRLIRSLLDRTSAQLIVSTHAAGIVNAGADRLVFVERTPAGSTARDVVGDADRYAAVRALGYQPSDLVLTPCAVWVEGPSDREYLRAWLGQHDLVDGIDFHIMFTSGALAAHLSADPEAFDEMLVAMRKFSRRCVIVADSDRSSATDDLKPWVERFQQDTGDDHGLCIVTWGREVENYLERDTVDQLFRDRGVRSVDGDHQWARVLPAKGKTMGKVALAKAYLEATGGAVPAKAVVHVKEIAAFVRASPEVD